MLHAFIMHLFDNYYETTAMIVYGIGFTTLLMNRNIIKKIIGFNFMDTAMYLFLASKGYITGRLDPIGISSQPRFEDYINPIPAGLVLTGIVVSVSFSAFFLALAIRLYKSYHTMDIDKIVRKMRNEQIKEEME
ncbi:MAG: cation:proton antiporter subunit C [Lachnospiraceae bacterium]|nr:cation:proton antiporter subunit C [Lachnospiraceae bacterium]